MIFLKRVIFLLLSSTLPRKNISILLNRLSIRYVIVPVRTPPSYVWGLAFYSHMWKTSSWPHHFTKRGRFGTINLNKSRYSLLKYIKPRGWAVMYVCDAAIDIVWFHDFSIGIWQCPTIYIIFVFCFLLSFYFITFRKIIKKKLKKILI